jgi:type I restriction-modification system DNA methylase subunit
MPRAGTATASASWKDRFVAAKAFSERWTGERRERAEKDSFWNEFLAIFDVDRRQVAKFEPVAQRYSTGRHGFIDLFWPGRLLVEHKSGGEDLNKAMDQAMDYLPNMQAADVPRLVVVCDFETFVVRDLDRPEERLEFPLDSLADHLDVFGFLAGRDRAVHGTEEDVNLAATALLARVHDGLREAGYDPHQRRILLTRILFCLFADDAQVWPRGLFFDFLLLRTREDGEDLGPQLAWLFEILDTPSDLRAKNLPPDIAEFSYINGSLFSERLPMASCDSEIRLSLVEASRFDWSKISPAIFGSMFQNVMSDAERRELGAHYTSEKNILRTITPLFIEDLRDELSRADSRPKLEALRRRLAGLRFFDPACGCGNFLVIAYREIRRIELECLRALRVKRRDTHQASLDVTLESVVHIGQFFGIEIEEFPCRIAETAMYLMDHLANLELSAEFGQYYARFPIEDSATIVNANALRVSWEEILPAQTDSFLFGNPPFVGMSHMSETQDADASLIFSELSRDVSRVGRLDYVASWYAKAFAYLEHTSTKAALVSTNSVMQGEQARSLGPLFTAYGIEIDFAHRSFAWTSDAAGSAAVHVVIVGFSHAESARSRRRLFVYQSPSGDPVEVPAKAINVYLVDAETWVVEKRTAPFVAVPKMTEGNRPEDGGGLIVDDDVATTLREGAGADIIAAQYLRPLIGAKQMLQGERRWCLWLVGANPQDIRDSPFLKARLQQVREARLSAVEKTRNDARKRRLTELANTPGLFTAMRQPQARWLCVPAHSSDNRRIVPMAFFGADDISHNSTQTVDHADNWLFGVMQSAMFTAWIKTTCGRIKSDIRVAPDMAYHAFPWPDPQRNRDAIIETAKQILEVRASYPDDSLAALYDPLSMPPQISVAHDRLDRAVERAYDARTRFDTDAKRLMVLFRRYAELLRDSPSEAKSLRH